MKVERVTVRMKRKMMKGKTDSRLQEKWIYQEWMIYLLLVDSQKRRKKRQDPN